MARRSSRTAIQELSHCDKSYHYVGRFTEKRLRRNEFPIKGSRTDAPLAFRKGQYPPVTRDAWHIQPYLAEAAIRVPIDQASRRPAARGATKSHAARRPDAV